MPPLTPEQQAFAEEHHGLILDFMEKHSLDDDYYGLLAQRYLKVVVRYLTEEELRKYSFSTVVWYHLRSELSNYARDQFGKPQEIPIEFYCEIPAPEIAPIDDGIWRVIEDNLTISSLRRFSSATRATPIVKLLNYAESVAKRLKSALPGSAKYYLIIRRTEL